MKKYWSLMVALVFLVVAHESMAADAKVGTSRSTSVTVIGANNGATTIDLRADNDGNLQITDATPPQLQNDLFPALDTVSVGSYVFHYLMRPLGLGWSASPFGSRSVQITRVQSKDTRGLRLYMFGSDDDVNYYPIIPETAWGQGADSSKVDTLQITIPPTFQNANTVRQFKVSLPESIYPGRYIQLWGYTTDSTVATGYQKVGVKFEGRWK